MSELAFYVARNLGVLREGNIYRKIFCCRLTWLVPPRPPLSRHHGWENSIPARQKEERVRDGKASEPH
jgi:hypothetical protein